MFSYTLSNLNHNQKTQFVYSLSGRGKEEGMVKKVEALVVGKGAFMVPIENTSMFEEFLEKWNLKYSKKNILVSL